MACENAKECPCPKDCKNHAKCYECVVNHRNKDKNESNYLPFCFRPVEEKK